MSELTLQLPDHLVTRLRGEASRQAVTVDSLAHHLLERSLTQEATSGIPEAPAQGDDANPALEMLQLFEELRADVPPEEWLRLPTDLSEQHDHYLYGTPKR